MSGEMSRLCFFIRSKPLQPSPFVKREENSRVHSRIWFSGIPYWTTPPTQWAPLLIGGGEIAVRAQTRFPSFIVLGGVARKRRGGLHSAYLIASGFTGEPTAPVMGSAGATKRNS